MAAPLTWLALGLSTLVLYVTQFVMPFGLLRWIAQPERTLGKITQWAPAAGWQYLCVFIVLFALWWVAYRFACLHHARRDWWLVLTFLALFTLALMFVYPIDAADVFDAIMRGRMLAWYRANPFYDVPADYGTDSIYPYVAWRYIGAAYGPLGELVGAGLALLAGPGVLGPVLVFKAGSIAGYAACLALIAAWQRRAAPERALAGVVLFGWCPQVLYATAEGAHNDLFMLVPVLLGYWLLQRGRHDQAIWALVAAALVKYIPILLVPLAAAYAYRQFGMPPFRPPAGGASRRKFIEYSLAAAFGALALVVIVFAPFWQGGDIMAAGRRGEMFTSSLPALVRAGLIAAAGVAPGLAGAAARTLAIVLLMLAGLVTMVAAAGPTPVAAARAGRDLLLFYLLVACLWLQPWYVAWPLALAALVPEDRGTRAAALLAFTLTCKVLVFEFLLMPGEVGPEEAIRELIVAPLLLGPVWLYLAWALVQRLRGRRPAAALTTPSSAP